MENYYCCYSEDPPEITDPEWPVWSLEAEFACQLGPCESDESTESDPVYSQARIKSGPHPTSEECGFICQRFTCTGLPGNRICIPNLEGEYLTIEECSEQCAPQVICEPSDEMAGWPSERVSGDDSTNFWSKVYAVPWEAGTVRVEYDAYNIPDRFQILAATLDPATGAPIATRIIKADSQYRGNPDSDCAKEEGLNLAGPGKGFIEWNKPENICLVEVAVIAPCVGTGWEFTISFEMNNAP